MLDNLNYNIILGAITAVCSAIGFIVKRLVSKIDKLEEESISKEEVRMLIADKVDPLKDRMERIEIKLDEIIHLLMRNK